MILLDKKKHKSLIRTYIILYIVVIYIVLQIAGVYDESFNIFDWYKAYEEYVENNGYIGIRFNGIYTFKGILVTTIVVLVYALLDYMDKSRKFMHGIEYGQAKWADPVAISDKFEDKKNPSHNRVYSQNVRIGMDGDKTRINNNSFINCSLLT